MSLCDLQRPVSLKCSRSKEADRRKAAVAVVNEIGKTSVYRINFGRLSVLTFKIQVAATVLRILQYKTGIGRLHGGKRIVDLVHELLCRINTLRNLNGITVWRVFTGRQVDVQAVVWCNNRMFLVRSPAAIPGDLVIGGLMFLKYRQSIVISVCIDPVDF